jgi:hypothetical protein
MQPFCLICAERFGPESAAVLAALPCGEFSGVFGSYSGLKPNFRTHGLSVVLGKVN